MTFSVSNQFDSATDRVHKCDIVFVADLFADQYTGGAELTTEALIERSKLSVLKLNARDVSMDVLRAGADKFWVFGNVSSVDLNLLPTIAVNLRYSVLAFDYAFCDYRSVEKCELAVGRACTCHERDRGKLVAGFYASAQRVWWMSEAQMLKWHERFPDLAERANGRVLGSVFSERHLDMMKGRREIPGDRSGYVICGSTSWIKGSDDAAKHCDELGVDYKSLWDLTPEDALDELSWARTFVYLPKGGDTCPRMVIEAKLVGCELVTNEHVQHADEPWFKDRSPDEIDAHLRQSPKKFWGDTERAVKGPTISGYVTALDCVRQRYPLRECIESMLAFCDEVVALDGGSRDGTWEMLLEMQSADTRVVARKNVLDRQHPRFARFDGEQKALARSFCTSEFCWQMDSDEIVDASDAPKIRELARHFPLECDVLALPVVEYWGSFDRVRCDVPPWKWRLSRNLPYITHGIPVWDRAYDAEGELCAKSSDGCFVIDSRTGEMVPFMSFAQPQTEQTRAQALAGDAASLRAWERWFDGTTREFPTVFHASWLDMTRKIRLYRNYWTSHWKALFGGETSDTAESNMFFDKPWSEVSESEIDELAVRMASETGGHVFHTRLDLSKSVPYIQITRQPPASMRAWLESSTKNTEKENG